MSMTFQNYVLATVSIWCYKKQTKSLAVRASNKYTVWS